MSRLPSWLWEQAVLFALVANATFWQVEKRLGGWHALTFRDAALLLLSGALVMASQKVRSMADRQRETNEAAGVADAPMSCSPRVALWSLVSQALGLAVGVATAPTWAHVLAAAFVAGYVPVWRRRVYRRWVRPLPGSKLVDDLLRLSIVVKEHLRTRDPRSKAEAEKLFATIEPRLAIGDPRMAGLRGLRQILDACSPESISRLRSKLTRERILVEVPTPGDAAERATHEALGG